jgi:hypothetical protein
MAEGPEIAVQRTRRELQKFAETIRGTFIEAVRLGGVLNEDQLKW